ncbi:hypothetical protein AB733_11670 [Photobacterium swingsii]|uniref:N-acetyltransferase domain-containing protein n=1 Tax=Photobacterium swingsii TaxID=680026 RepID=A0A0J8VB59_9GAMM|nr:hypothetical protein [Photobacterium swingsii]KMV30337.1 hypothetical protein AB733_11670 [Photobacterium swingsii]PSW24500.1 hypothetical protein C9I94_10715 [Photobacterium swingsii]
MEIIFKKVNYDIYRSMLERKLMCVATRDDIPDLVEDTFRLLRDGKAHLFLCPTGGAILEPVIDNGIACINVVFGWNTNGRGILDYSGVYEKLARDIGATRIISFARREGVFRLWKRQGFYKVGYNEQGLIKFAKDLR